MRRRTKHKFIVMALRYECQAGQDVKRAIVEATQQAQRFQKPVQFTHNGVVVVVTGRTRFATAFHQWEQSLRARSKAYHASPEGIAADEAYRQQRLRYQQEADALMARLTSGMSASVMVAWVGAFAMYSDTNYIRYDKPRVIATLQTAGYHAGECCGDPRVTTDPSVFARWFLGQTLAGLTGNVGAIHPIADKFAADYKRMFGAAESEVRQ